MVPFVWQSYAFYAAAILTVLSAFSSVGVAIAAISAAVVAFLWPPPRPQRKAELVAALDSAMPEYDHSEFHEIVVDSPPERVWLALKELRFEHVPWIERLMRIRQMAAPRVKTRSGVILDALMRPGSGFFLVDQRPGSEIVMGMVGRPWANDVVRPSGTSLNDFREPESVRIAINFLVLPAGAQTRISTETRIVGVDTAGSRKFTRYWRLVYPGSAIMRHVWLQAIARQAMN
jgi:hypothetical protein